MPDTWVLARLPSQLAGRLLDGDRDWAGETADGAEWDLLIGGLAGAVVHQGVPVTAEELGILNQGLRWADDEEIGDPVDPAVAVSDADIQRRLQRWRFEPAPASGEPHEEALVAALARQPAARWLGTAWRIAPDGRRVRAYVVVCSGSPHHVWGRAYYALLEALQGRRPADQGIAVEVVEDEQPQTLYQRSLAQAARQLWTRAGGRRP